MLVEVITQSLRGICPWGRIFIKGFNKDLKQTPFGGKRLLVMTDDDKRQLSNRSEVERSFLRLPQQQNQAHIDLDDSKIL